MAESRTIAIIGAGLVGSGWAVVFARAGHDVRVYDPVAEGLVENAALSGHHQRSAIILKICITPEMMHAA